MTGLLLTTPRAWVRRAVGRLPGVDLPSPLVGRTVMVTGASSGIGEATARAVASRGGRVLLVARRAESSLASPATSRPRAVRRSPIRATSPTRRPWTG